MQANYRELKGYKYELVEDYRVVIPIFGMSIDHRFIQLHPSGLLIIKKEYAWDGPSGPTIDTPTFMRGSLVHDALYQLIRSEALDVSFREQADKILRDICLEDGMNSIRAWYVYWSVRLFAANCAKPGTQKPYKVYSVPSKK